MYAGAPVPVFYRSTGRLTGNSYNLLYLTDFYAPFRQAFVKHELSVTVAIFLNGGVLP